MDDVRILISGMVNKVSEKNRISDMLKFITC